MVDSVDELLARKVSYQANAWAAPTDEQSVQKVLHDIRCGTYATHVQYLRDLVSRGERDRYAIEKKRLPGVTFSGIFDGRRLIPPPPPPPKLKEYTELLVLDIDHLSRHDVAKTSTALPE